MQQTPLPPNSDDKPQKSVTISYTTVGAVVGRHYYMNVRENGKEVQAIRLDYLFQVSDWLQWLKETYKEKGFSVTVLRKHGGRWEVVGD